MPGKHAHGHQVALCLEGAALDVPTLAAVQGWLLTRLRPTRYVLAAVAAHGGAEGGSAAAGTIELWAVCAHRKRADNVRASAVAALPALHVAAVAVSSDHDDLPRAAAVFGRAAARELCWLHGYMPADLVALPTTARPARIHIPRARAFEILTTRLDWSAVVRVRVPHGGAWAVPAPLCVRAAACAQCAAFVAAGDASWDGYVADALRAALACGYDTSALYSPATREQLARALQDWWVVVVCAAAAPECAEAPHTAAWR